MSDILKRIGGFTLVAMMLVSCIGFWIGYFQSNMREMIVCGFGLTWVFIWIEKVKKNV